MNFPLALGQQQQRYDQLLTLTLPLGQAQASGQNDLEPLKKKKVR